VEQQTGKVYDQLKKAASDDFNKTLEQMGWPSKDLNIDNKTAATWTEQVKTLLDLQTPDLMSQSAKLRDEAFAAEPVILLPLEVMVDPLQLRFRYHFYGNRPTNRLDKPEYFLSHILDLLEDHNGFLLEYLQPIMDDRSRSVPELDDVLCPDATSAFISALLPMVRCKVLALLPQISPHPQLLSHFMHELMSFDTTLRDSWAYTPTPHSASEWKGLSWSVLVTHQYFETWLKVEKDFALTRYEAIISASDSGEIDYESVESGSTKPTKSAIRVNDLLETITDRYRPLSSFSQKLRFLIDIQLELFDQYHQRLHGSLERYIMDTSTLGKVIQGSTGTANERGEKHDLNGMYGLESLCKVFGSAEYLERKMSDWGDDIFFLELWDELQDRARRNAGTNASVGRDLTTSEVASRTSAIIKQTNDPDAGETDGGALFDETATAYRRLRLKAEEQINELLINAITTSLRPYSKTPGWSSLTSPDNTNNTNNTTTSSTTSSLTPSPTLDSALHLLSTTLSFLSQILSPTPLRRITRQLCLAIQRHIWDYVLTRHHFSASGAQQLKADVEAIQRVVDACVRSPANEAARGMRRLNEGIALLALPVKVPNVVAKVRAGMGEEGEVGEGEGEEGWGFDDNDDKDNNHNNDDDAEIIEVESKAGGGGGGGGGGARITDTASGRPADSNDENDNDEDDDADADADVDTNLHDNIKIWSLAEVEKRVFSSNESARAILLEMGLVVLTEAEARAVLERRVELVG